MPEQARAQGRWCRLRDSNTRPHHYEGKGSKRRNAVNSTASRVVFADTADRPNDFPNAARLRICQLTYERAFVQCHARFRPPANPLELGPAVRTVQAQ